MQFYAAHAISRKLLTFHPLVLFSFYFIHLFISHPHAHTFKYCTLCVLTEFNKIHDDDRLSIALAETTVNSARPSSGCRGCFPLSAATTPGLRPGVALPPASPLSRVCPRRRGGSPSGDLSAPPALSLRGCGPKALDRPPSVERMREGDFPPLAIPVGDKGEFTHVILLTLSAWSMRFVPTAFRPSDVARGFV